MERAPFAPGGGHHRTRSERDVPIDQGADYRFALDGRPQTRRGFVEHQFVGAIEQAAGTESQHAFRDGALVRDDGAAQRAVDNRELDVAEPIGRELVPRQDALRIRARLAIDDDAEHDVAIAQIAGLSSRDDTRVHQWRDTVDANATPIDLVKPDRGAHTGREERLHPRIDARVDFALEFAVRGMGLVRQCPHPLTPAVQCVVEALAGLLFEEAQKS